MDEKKMNNHTEINVGMTVEKIIAALECCLRNEMENTCAFCLDCPASDWDCEDNLECNASMMKNAIDLIHRLQDKNEQLKDEKEEIRLFNLSMQNGKVDMRIESEMVKSFYNSIIQIFEQNGAKNFFTATVDIEGKKGRYAFTIEKVGGQTVAEKLAEQKAEIERLTDENGQLK